MYHPSTTKWKAKSTEQVGEQRRKGMLLRKHALILDLGWGAKDPNRNDLIQRQACTMTRQDATRCHRTWSTP